MQKSHGESRLIFTGNLTAINSWIYYINQNGEYDSSAIRNTSQFTLLENSMFYIELESGESVSSLNGILRINEIFTSSGSIFVAQINSDDAMMNIRKSG